MPFLRWEIPMADEIPETAGAATRNLLSAVGFILILLGGEILLDKTGDRFPLGLGLVVAGIPIFFVGVFWKWLQRRFATGIAKKLNWIAADPIWWVALFSVFTAFSFTQLGLGATALILAPLGIGCATFAWRKAGKATARGGDDIALVDAQWRNKTDAQIARDILLLLDFAVHQTTSELLDGLIKITPQRILAEPLVLAAEHYEEATKYLEQVRSKLAGSHRISDIATQLSDGEWQAEQQLRETPPEKRPAGIDPLDLRKWAIANRQCWLVSRYLISQLSEVKENLRTQRSGLIERFRLRSPQ
jgi:hypothetical protein